MGLSTADGDDGYDRSDEDDNFLSWSDKRRASASPSPDEQTSEKAPPKTLTELLADAATDREKAENTDSD